MRTGTYSTEWYDIEVLCWMAYFRFLQLVWLLPHAWHFCNHFWTSQSICTHSVATQHHSLTAVMSFYAFQHLVHFKPIKNRSLLAALLLCKWKLGYPCLQHKTHNRNALSSLNLHYSIRREKMCITSHPTSSVVNRTKYTYIVDITDSTLYVKVVG
jgi:transposase-like protein